MLDQQVVLAHILGLLQKNNLAVSRREVLNCFNTYYKKRFHGDKKSYLTWLYDEFGVREGAVTNPKRSHRSRRKTKEAITDTFLSGVEE